MDFLNSSRMTRDEILAVFRVPPPITGIVENMGLGADIWFGARVMFCEGTVQPKLDLIGQALTRDLASPLRAGRGGELSPTARRATSTSAARTTSSTPGSGCGRSTRSARAAGCDPFPDPRFDKPILPR